MSKFRFVTIEQGVKPFPIHASFIQAWNDMFSYVNDMVKRKQVSHQIIETVLWIETSGDRNEYPIMFYDARDKAINEYGWKKPNE